MTTPDIVMQPENMDGVLPNSNVTFTVIVMGEALNYQWSMNGNEIPGATQDTLTLVGVGMANEGMYSCFISNRAGNVTSDVVSLTVCKYRYLALGQYIDKVLCKYCKLVSQESIVW